VKPILIAPLLGIAFLFPAVAQDTGTRAPLDAQKNQRTPAEQASAEELNQAARSYREGNFVEAQQHSEKALAFDPSNKTALSFLARTIHAQYKPGVQSEENVAKAREALDAYKRILIQEPLHEESYKAIAYLYGELKEDEQQRQWIYQRALDLNVSEAKRAEAYIVLASKAWDCSFKITELPTHKIAEVSDHRVVVQYIKPKNPADFEKARQCAANGLEFTEAAITLTPNSEGAWSYKTNLLLEMSKLAEMDKDVQLKTEYKVQMEAARLRTAELSDDDANGRQRKP
jgi:tetratricopeptide (TPR) repeat protein